MLADDPLWGEIRATVAPKASHQYLKKKQAKRQAKLVFTPYVEPRAWRSMVKLVESSDGLVHHFYKDIKVGI